MSGHQGRRDENLFGTLTEQHRVSSSCFYFILAIERCAPLTTQLLTTLLTTPSGGKKKGDG